MNTTALKCLKCGSKIINRSTAPNHEITFGKCSKANTMHQEGPTLRYWLHARGVINQIQMKTRTRELGQAWIALTLLIFAGVNSAVAQGTAFTYSGRLNNNGAPVNGAYDLRFTLHDASAAGNMIAGPLTVGPVDVANGLFTARIDFGADVFTGPPRWLHLEVRPLGGGGFTPLDPRQELTSSPYSIRAQTAGSVANSSVAANQLNTGGVAPTPGQFLSYNGGNLFWTDPGIAAGNIWSLKGINAYYTAGGVGIGTNNPEAGYSLEVKGATRLTTGGSGGVVRFGTPSGETGMTIIGANRADLRFDGSTIKLLASAGTGVPPNANGITVDTLGNVGVGQSVLFGSQTRQMLNMFGTGFGIGVQTADLYFRSGSGFAWHWGGTHNDNTYNSGGGTTLLTLDNTTGLNFGSRLGQHLSLWGGTSSRRFDIGIQAATLYTRCGNNVGDAFAWYKGGAHNDNARNPGGGQTLMTLDGEAGLFVAGAASICALTIRGGCDLAEPFPMKEEEIEKSSVVVIDDEHPGQLKRSTEAYDTRVAGIVSGANGVNAGIALHQDGLLEAGQNVALSGRVYVQADATFGAIKPGDLLTTSNTPGHAMKVSDHGKAQGAILGKAMTPLAEGRGMVLALVTLQ
jgi:hypothetical protein